MQFDRIPRATWERLARTLLVLYVLGVYWVLLTPSPPQPPVGSDKVGHVALSFLLGILVALAAVRFPVHVRIRLLLLVGLVVGVSTEWLQGGIATRNLEAGDVAANLIGTVLAGIVAPWVGRRDETVAEADAAPEETG